jgi:Protein of unknown function (DUF1571)
MRKFIFFLAFIITGFSEGDDKPNCKIILKKMISEIENIHSMRYKLHAMERVGGKFLIADSELKIVISPRKVYLKNSNKKLEVLYNDGENNNHAFINSNKFPAFCISLNPTNGIMRKAQHHTIHDLGFAYISQIISGSMNENSQIFEKSFFYLGIVERNGRQCHKIYNEFKNFKYINYTIKKSETIRSISDKFNCGDYRILEKNSSIKFGQVLSEGTIITVPNCYSSKTILYIDAITSLPLSIRIFDDEGLYEVYEFTEVCVNTVFKDDEFSKKYFEYNF